MASSLINIGGILQGYNPSLSSPTQPTQGTAVVKDGYSNKYYGNQSFSELSTYLKNLSDSYSAIIASQSKPLYGSNPTNQSGFLQNTLSVSGQAEEQLKSVNEAMSSINPNNYVQHSQVIESYQAHPDGWDTYFKSNYQNPRIAEANASQLQGSSQSPLAIATPKKVETRQVNTGIAGTTTINPFGRLDAGLGV